MFDAIFTLIFLMEFEPEVQVGSGCILFVRQKKYILNLTGLQTSRPYSTVKFNQKVFSCIISVVCEDSLSNSVTCGQ